MSGMHPRLNRFWWHWANHYAYFRGAEYPMSRLRAAYVAAAFVWKKRGWS